jgi:hypothetical protein
LLECFAHFVEAFAGGGPIFGSQVGHPFLDGLQRATLCSDETDAQRL